MMKFKCFLLVTAVFVAAQLSSAPRTCQIEINNKDNKKVHITAEIADTPEKRTRGLMYRKKMPWNRGMVFVFEKSQRLNFWMKNTYIPLDIAYIDKNGIIKKILSMKPLRDDIYYPSIIAVRYALEMNRHWFKKNNISKGCRVILDGCVGK